MFAEIYDYIDLVVGLILIDYYGWIVFVLLFLWMAYTIFIENQQFKYLSTIKWVFLEVRVDELNEKSPVAMEQIFASMHAMFQGFTLGEKWSGKIALYMSAEIVSIGGRISFIFKVPERYRNLLESAVFAQYPKAEIREIQDYLAHLPRVYDPQKSEFEMWGTQLIKKADNAMPIRTYRQRDKFYEHSEQETIIEPLSNVIEVMSNISPAELMVIQIVAKPASDDWKVAAYDEVAKKKGLPPKAKPVSIIDKILFEWPGALVGALAEALGAVGEADKKEEKKEQSLLQTMSDTEKYNIDSMVSSLSKQSFTVKIRIMYLAPKANFNKGIRIPEIFGAFRAFDNHQLNGFKPDVKNITTDATYKLSQKLEQPWINHKILIRKNKFLKALKDRSHYKGSGNTILSTEELATIFHFPQVPNARVSQIEKVHTVKSAPPIDLPVA